MRGIPLAALAVVLLAGCAATPSGPRAIESITFSQFQAIEDFDDADYTQDDPKALAEFQALLDQYDVVPGQTVTTVEDQCDGGLSSTVAIDYADDSTAEMFIADCGEPDFDDFNAAANDLLTDWRQALGGTR
jgi:hypothetical protein